MQYLHNEQYYIDLYDLLTIRECLRIIEFGREVFKDSQNNEEFKKVSLDNYRGKWLVLFFYPADFTFVCPTELEDMADHYETFQQLNTEILSVSTDTHFVHKAWHDNSETIKCFINT